MHSRVHPTFWIILPEDCDTAHPIATQFEDDVDTSSPTLTQFGGEVYIKAEVLNKRVVTDIERIIPFVIAQNKDMANR